MQPTNDREEDMRILSSGDVHVSHQSPQQQPTPQGSGIGKVLAGAALGASLLGIPGAGIAGYLLNQLQQRPQQQTTQQPQPTGETVDLGLKKIEDLEL